jgi:hypothetical protein
MILTVKPRIVPISFLGGKPKKSPTKGALGKSQL